MKLYLLLLSTLLLSNCSSKKTTPSTSMNDNTQTSFYDLSVLALNGIDTINFSDFKGKKILLVNVASKCGYTPQYEGLQKLYEENKDSLIIIGFPCNQFGSQEPGSSETIASFCSLNYGVEFPLSTKINVKGDSIHPIYNWLTNKQLNGVGDYSVSWNFNKFLISEEGKLISYFGTKVKPYDKELLDAIKS